MNSEPPVVWHGRKVEAVIFDLDGTLIDSIEIYYQALTTVTSRIGLQVSREEIFEPMAEGLDPWERLFHDRLPNLEEKMRQFRREMRPIFLDALDRVRPFPGVREVLSLLLDRKIKLGVVTDSSDASLKPLHENTLNSYFHAIVTHNDGLPKKPEPLGILECLSRMGAQPGNAVVVGDTLMDVRAGKGAGTLTLGVLSGLATRTQFEKDPPNALVQDVTLVPSVLGLR